MGACISAMCTSNGPIPTGTERLSDSNGSGLFEFGPNKIGATYSLKNPQVQGAHQKLAELERNLFTKTCNNKKLDYKPRENIRQHFLQHNSIEDHGRIPTPPLRVRSNELYQFNISKGVARI